MASSRKSTLQSLADRVSAASLPLIPEGSSILIGLSGGVDSVVLLHLLHQLAPLFSWKLSALHVHHGISPNANAWADFCKALCAEHDVPLCIERVDIAPLRSQGIEAAARQLRHTAFAAQLCDVVALAHHADDQVETLFLQLLRGAGVKGASAMPALSDANVSKHAAVEAHQFWRPLLHCTRQEIFDYASAHDLQWIEDESNGDDSYPRNFLRHRLLPVLSQRFPAYRETLTRSTQHFSEAGKLLDELAQMDAGECVDTLSVTALKALSESRAKNLLRYFLHRRGATMPQVVQLDEMLHQLCGAREDAGVCIRFGEWQVRRYRSRIYALRTPGDYDRNLVLPWMGEAVLNWPALNSQVQFQASRAQGISLTKLQRATVTVRFRKGGERLQPTLKGATRTLKNLLQEHAIPPWERDRWPLIYCGDDLVCVPGVAVSESYQARNGEAAVAVFLSAVLC